MLVFGGIAAAALGAVGLIWLGYPTVVWLRSRVAGQPLRADPQWRPTVSVVLATRDHASAIDARVHNLLATDYPGALLEVVIAIDADGAQSTPAQLTVADPRVRVVAGDAPGGKAATLNAGVRAATGEVLVLADVAQRFEPTTIPALVAELADPRAGAVSGALDLGPGTGRFSPVRAYWTLEKWLRFHEARRHASIGVTGAVYATRRALWPVIPAGTILDDVYVPMALVLQGWRVGFTYAAIARDVRVIGLAAEQQRKARTLTGNLQLVQLLPAILTAANPARGAFVWHKLARLTTPAWLLVAVVAGAPWLITRLLTWSPAQQLALGALLLLALGIPHVRRRLLGPLMWGLGMQVAVVRALRNAAGGRWAVWQKPSV
ncbi:MAG: glycosyltransferase [Gemmatimonadaceae bacterium]